MIYSHFEDMEDTNSLIEFRRQKLRELNEKGMNPFRNKFTPSETCAQAKESYEEGRPAKLAGRISAQRVMGKSQFLDLHRAQGRGNLITGKEEPAGSVA